MNKYASLFTPDFSHLTGLLKHLNTEELRTILDSDDKVNDMISDLKQVKDIESEKEMLLAGNKSISEYNLSQQSVLRNTQEELETTYQRAVLLKDKLIAAKQNLETKASVRTNDTLLALLQAATSEIDEEAEATVDAFLKNDLSVEDFIEKYLELRKLAHLRRIKSEKLTTIIQGSGNNAFIPNKPQRHRKPPPPPVPKLPAQPYPNVMPNQNIANQNTPFLPSRPAPQPPPIQNYPHNMSYPSPFAYCSPYPMPQFPNYTTKKQ